jgi:hypothetical protein
MQITVSIHFSALGISLLCPRAGSYESRACSATFVCRSSQKIDKPSNVGIRPQTDRQTQVYGPHTRSIFFCFVQNAYSKPQEVTFLSQFNVYGSVHRKNILIYIQQDATLHSLFYLETALHVSGGTSTHYQERKQLYLQHLVLVTPLLLPAAIAAGSSKINCVTLHLVGHILEYFLSQFVRV